MAAWQLKYFLIIHQIKNDFYHVLIEKVISLKWFFKNGRQSKNINRAYILLQLFKFVEHKYSYNFNDQKRFFLFSENTFLNTSDQWLKQLLTHNYIPIPNTPTYYCYCKCQMLTVHSVYTNSLICVRIRIFTENAQNPPRTYIAQIWYLIFHVQWSDFNSYSYYVYLI